MIKYKIDVVKALNDRGYNSYKLKQSRALSQGTLKKLKDKQNVTLETINAVCCMLRCQISDIIEIEFSDEDKLKYF